MNNDLLKIARPIRLFFFSIVRTTFVQLKIFEKSNENPEIYYKIVDFFVCTHIQNSVLSLPLV